MDLRFLTTLSRTYDKHQLTPSPWHHSTIAKLPEKFLLEWTYYQTMVDTSFLLFDLTTLNIPTMYEHE